MQKQIGYLVLRVVPAAIMLFSHGLGKLQGYANMKNTFPDPLGIGSNLSLISTITTELGCAALLMLGLYTRLSALALSFTMFVAAFIVHASDPFSKKEFALIYAVIFFAVFLLGPGKWSLDYRVRKKL